MGILPIRLMTKDNSNNIKFRSTVGQTFLSDRDRQEEVVPKVRFCVSAAKVRRRTPFPETRRS